MLLGARSHVTCGVDALDVLPLMKFHHDVAPLIEFYIRPLSQLCVGYSSYFDEDAFHFNLRIRTDPVVVKDDATHVVLAPLRIQAAKGTVQKIIATE